MRALGWLVLFVAAVAAMWWTGLKGMAVLVTVVGGLGGLAYLVVRTLQPVPSQEVDRSSRQADAERHMPPPS